MSNIPNRRSTTTKHSNTSNSRKRQKSSPLKKFLFLVIIFILVVSFTLFILQRLSGGKIVFIPGKVIYSDSLTTKERQFLESIFTEEIKLPSDVSISAHTVDTAPKKDRELIYDVILPVTNFNSARDNISRNELSAKDLDPTHPTTPKKFNQENSEFALVSIKDLDPTVKLLKLDGDYYLDSFKTGAYFRVFELKTANFKVAADLIKAKIGNLPTKKNTLTLNQTGVTALSRGMQTMLKKQDGDATYFSANIADFLSSTDLTHISNEVSFSEDCQTSSGSVTLCSPMEMMDTLDAVGTDIVELTGNHNNDWGKAANRATLDLYAKKGYKTFGGGKDEETASVPLEINAKSNHITLIGVNESTSTKENGQGASGKNPGANIYDRKVTEEQIKAAKDRGDFVLVDVQYFECYSYPAEGMEMISCDYPISGQQDFFRDLIDMGADMVVGTQAHQPQTYELYHGKPIYYGLGNLFFDQIYWPGTRRGLILTHYFKGSKLLQTKISPTIYGQSLQVELMEESAAEKFLTRLSNAAEEL